MKISRSAYEVAMASAGEADVPLILTGSKGLITDVTVSPSPEIDTSAGMLPSMMPAGLRRYGKVVTKNDEELEAGYNLIKKDDQWVFVDEDGSPQQVEIVDLEGEDEDDTAVLEE
jgi:hypothetical protein